jgi:hypothetical protein
VLLLLAATGTTCPGSETHFDAKFAVSEQAAAGAVLGRAATAIPESGAAASTFEIVAGNTDETFAIDRRTGELRVARPESLDYEARSRYELTVRIQRAAAADAAQRQFAADLLASSIDPADVANLFMFSEERQVLIDVLDVNEPPVISVQSLTLVGDFADPTADVGQIHGVDPDRDDVLTYEVIAGDPAGLLTLDAASGCLALAQGISLPAGQQVVPLTVRVTDQAGHSDAATVSVRLVGIPAPLIAESPPSTQTSDPVMTSPLDDTAAPPSAESVELPPAPADVSAAPQTTPTPLPSRAGPRQFTRPALWFFLAGVLLGAGLMTIVFRFVGRTSPAGGRSTGGAAPNPFGQLRPQPIMVSTREQLRSFRRSTHSPVDPAPVAADAAHAAVAQVERGDSDAADDDVAVRDRQIVDPLSDPVDSGMDANRPQSGSGAVPETAAQPPVPLTIPHWSRVLRFAAAATQDRPEEQPAVNEATAPPGTIDSSVAHNPADAAPDDYQPQLDSVTTGPAHEWAGAALLDEPPQLVPPAEFGWDSPLHGPADHPPEPASVQDGSGASDDPHDVRQVDDRQEASDVVQDVYAMTDAPELANVLDDVHDPLWASQSPEPMDEPHVPEVVKYDAADRDQAPEFAAPAVAPFDWPDVTPDPDAVGPVDDQHAAAALEAVEALEGTESPLGVEPRVAELRRQLTELFGVPADRPSRIDEEPADEPGPSIEYHVVKEVASDSARVDGLFESLRASLDGKTAAAAEATGDLTSAPDAVVVTPLTAEIELGRSAQAEPAARVNKSAVRQEISSLREVANNYARAIVARQTTEKRARIVWLVSAGCMVPLFSGGTYLLTSMPPGALRWLGWLLLTGGAGAFSICLNSFNRLSKLHEETQRFDEPYPESQTSAKDTAEFDVPPELVSKSSASEPVSQVPAAELDAEQPEPEPAEVGAV